MLAAGGAQAADGVSWVRSKTNFVGGLSETIGAITAFGNAHPLQLNATGPNYGDFAVVYTAPILPNSFVVLGEVTKIVPVSKQRVADLSAPEGSKQVQMQLIGASGETVEMTYLQPGKSEPRRASCTMSPAGTCSVTLQ